MTIVLRQSYPIIIQIELPKPAKGLLAQVVKTENNANARISNHSTLKKNSALSTKTILTQFNIRILK